MDNATGDSEDLICLRCGLKDPWEFGPCGDGEQPHWAVHKDDAYCSCGRLRLKTLDICRMCRGDRTGKRFEQLDEEVRWNRLWGC